MPLQPPRVMHIEALGYLTNDSPVFLSTIGKLLVDDLPDCLRASVTGNALPSFDFRYSPSFGLHCECKLVSESGTFVVIVHEGLLLLLRVVSEILSVGLANPQVSLKNKISLLRDSSLRFIIRPDDPLGLSASSLLDWPPPLRDVLSQLLFDLDENSFALANFLLRSAVVFTLGHEIAHLFSSSSCDRVPESQILMDDLALLNFVADEASPAWVDEFRADDIAAQIVAAAVHSPESQLRIYDCPKIERLPSTWNGMTCLVLGGAICLAALHAIDLYRVMDSSVSKQRSHPTAGARFCAWLRNVTPYAACADLETARILWHELNTLLVAQLNNLEQRVEQIGQTQRSFQEVRRYLSNLSDHLNGRSKDAGGQPWLS